MYSTDDREKKPYSHNYIALLDAALRSFLNMWTHHGASVGDLMQLARAAFVEHAPYHRMMYTVLQ